MTEIAIEHLYQEAGRIRNAAHSSGVPAAFNQIMVHIQNQYYHGKQQTVPYSGDPAWLTLRSALSDLQDQHHDVRNRENAEARQYYMLVMEALTDLVGLHIVTDGYLNDGSDYVAFMAIQFTSRELMDVLNRAVIHQVLDPDPEGQSALLIEKIRPVLSAIPLRHSVSYLDKAWCKETAQLSFEAYHKLMDDVSKLF